MKYNNRPIIQTLDNNQRQRANDLFLKLYPKWKGKKTWDVIREQTYPSKEIKPGGNINDPV